jgi:uncharacterized protein YozE (UPF0346 family)
MELSLSAYNFLAERNNWTEVSTSEELNIGYKEYNIKKVYSMIRVSDHSLMCNLYTWGTDMDLVKEVNGEITEYYTVAPENFSVSIEGMLGWVSRDLSTNEILEYYVYDSTSSPKKEMKYNMVGKLLQTNYTIQKFDELPEEYQNLLIDYPDKDKICLYSNKPYGMIVEISQTVG